MFKSSWKIKLIGPEDVEDAMKLLRRTFYVDEPMLNSLQLWDENNPCEELEWYSRSTLSEGKSLQAVDKDGKMASILVIGEIPLNMENNGELLEMVKKCKNPKALKVIEIVMRRDETCRLWEKYPQHKTLVEIKMAATDPQYRKKGLMNKLMAKAINNAKKQQVHLLRMDTSSQYSTRCAERFGFTCIYKALYADIKTDGNPVLAPEAPHLYDRVFIKELFKMK